MSKILCVSENILSLSDYRQRVGVMETRLNDFIGDFLFLTDANE
jgi:hypothetical protein